MMACSMHRASAQPHCSIVVTSNGCVHGETCQGKFLPPKHMPMISSNCCRPMVFSLSTIQRANMSNSVPCPKSPNMTAKRKGKVTMVKGAGLASLYLATPYASTISWKECVTLLVWKYVGGCSYVTRGWKIVLTCKSETHFSIPWR